MLPRNIVLEVSVVRVGRVNKSTTIKRVREDNSSYREPKNGMTWNSALMWLHENGYMPSRNAVRGKGLCGTQTERHFFHRSLMGTIAISEEERAKHVRVYGA